MRVAYSYIRFSSKKQAKGDSYRRQTDLSRTWAERNECLLSEQTYQDLGVSGWTGKNWKEGGLALFLEAIREGKIKPGSFLLLENLDRLSRDQIDRALNIFCEILRAGITIVTLEPERRYSKANLDSPTSLFEPIMQFILANEASEKLSKRLKETWTATRKTGKKIGALAPAWLKWDKANKTYQVIPEKAAIVKKIYDLRASGLGNYQIVRWLHEHKIKNIGHGKRGWNHSYIHLLLHHRGVLGERVLYKLVDGKRVPDATFPDYYPAIVDKGLFYRVQDMLNTFKDSFRGRGSRVNRNLLQGLLKDARDGGSIIFSHRRKCDGKKPWRFVGSYNALRKQSQTPWIAFPYDELEFAILMEMKELKREDFFPPAVLRQDEEIDKLEGQLAEVAVNIRTLQKRVLSGTSAKSILSLLEELDSRKQELEKSLDVLKAKQHRKDDSAFSDLLDLVEEMNLREPHEQTEIRERLRGRLRVLLDSVWLLLSKHKSERPIPGYNIDKRAIVELRFKNGVTRQFALLYSGAVLSFLGPTRFPPLTDLPKEFARNDPEATLQKTTTKKRPRTA